MDLNVLWLKPFALLDGRDTSYTYVVDGMESIDPVPGVYVFGRRHGSSFSPIYIGKAINLAQRIKQQLNNNRLMNALYDAPSGQRQLLVGELITKGGQRADSAVAVIERGLIKLALVQGHDIVNKSGTRLRSHKVSMTGNRMSRSWIQKGAVHFER